MGRKDIARLVDQKEIDWERHLYDTLNNCRQHPIDEAPDAYKDFSGVLRSVELAGLATPVAKLKARSLIKDGDMADD